MNDGQAYFKSVIEGLMWETQLLDEWFRREYPESTLTVIVDANNVLRTMKITCRVLMGEEMVKNRGYFENVVSLQEKQIFNKNLMNGFLKVFNEQYRKAISHAVNNHFHMERAKEQSFDVV